MGTNGRALSMNKPYTKPLFLKPVFKQMIWGGSKLASDWNYEIPGDNTGECWAVSAHPHGDCEIADGEYAGQKLSELWNNHPELFGNLKTDKFPLLTKIIDAKEDLSIQVHPDDAYAKSNENGAWGKPECWYVLDCKVGASLVIGHNAKTKEELEHMIREGKWAEFIREIPIKKGDFIQIDPGTVHAIKGGVTLLETQQSSDITYRVYDYNRLSDGKPRELHIEKSLEVIETPAKNVSASMKHFENSRNNILETVFQNEYYKIFKADIEGEVTIKQDNPFLIISVIGGCGMLNNTCISKSDHFIIPSGVKEMCLEGKMTLFASAPVTK